MRPGKTILTEAWLRKVTKERDETALGEHTDGGCRGLRIWIAKDFVVSFSLRLRLKGVSKRYHEELKPTYWSPAFTLAQARDACNIRRGELRRDGLKPKVEPCSLGDALPQYVAARMAKDKQTSRRRADLPEKWGEHIGNAEEPGRFLKIFKPLLGTLCGELNRDHFMNCMSAYGATWAAEREKEWDDRVLRPMMVCAMPFLNWCVKAKGLSADAVEDIVPEDYDPDERYLFPGEWQACAPHIDKLRYDCGLFVRFVLATCVRSEQALCMEWQECGWGNGFLKFTDETGAEHDALIWTVPRDKKEGGMKMRKKGSKKLPNSVLITGDSLVILKRLRAIWEEEQKDPRNAGYNGVFTKTMKHKWRTARTDMQRGIEEEAGCARWDRMTLRHTHATYLTLLGCPPALVSMSMVHSPGKQSVAGGKLMVAADVTSRYVGPVASKRFMTNDPLAALGPWHLRLHKLFRDMERGNIHSVELTSIIADLRTDASAVNVRAEHGIAERFVDVKPTQLVAVS